MTGGGKSPEPQFTHQESSGVWRRPALAGEPPLSSCFCFWAAGAPAPAIPPGLLTQTSGSLWGQGMVATPPGAPARTAQQTGRPLKDVVARGGCTRLLGAAEAAPPRPGGCSVGVSRRLGVPAQGVGGAGSPSPEASVKAVPSRSPHVAGVVGHCACVPILSSYEGRQVGPGPTPVAPAHRHHSLKALSQR